MMGGAALFDPPMPLIELIRRGIIAYWEITRSAEEMAAQENGKTTSAVAKLNADWEKVKETLDDFCARFGKANVEGQVQFCSPK